MRKLIFAVLMLSIAKMSIADNDQVAEVYVTKLNTYTDFTIVYFAPNFSFTQGCEKSDANKAVIRFGGAKQEMFSALLSAAMTRKKVSMGVNGCDSTGYPTIYRVDVYFDTP
ncbi:MAG: hypothetical protein P8Y45_21625 [Exilibacterium sp.]